MFDHANDSYGNFFVSKSSGCAEFSFVISAYNSEKTIKASLESIPLAFYPGVEIVIINDGSSDGTLDSILEYANDYPGQFTIVNQTNMGLTKSLNRGISLASGEFIVRQDADDFSYPVRIDELRKALGEADFVMSQADVLTAGGDFIKKSTRKAYFHSGIFPQKLIFGNPFVHGTFAFKKAIFPMVKYDIDFKFSQDFDFLLQILNSGLKVKFIERPLYAFVKNDKSISALRKAEQSNIAKQILAKHNLTSRFYLSDQNGVKRFISICLRELLLCAYSIRGVVL